MIASIFKNKTMIALAGALSVSGCGYFPEETKTDSQIIDLIASTDDKQSLAKKYYPTVDAKGNQIGIVFVNSVTEDSESEITCIKYQAFHSGDGDWKAIESDFREACASSALKLTKN